MHEPALERQSPDDYKGGQVLVARGDHRRAAGAARRRVSVVSVVHPAEVAELPVQHVSRPLYC